MGPTVFKLIVRPSPQSNCHVRSSESLQVRSTAHRCFNWQNRLLLVSLSGLRARGQRFGPLFIHADGRSLSRSSFTKKLSALCSQCGFSGDITSLSFRIGVATTASSHGISDSVIQKLGRWSSDAFKAYVRSSPLLGILRVFLAF